MLIGIPANVYRAETGEFVIEVDTNEIADGLDEVLGDIHGIYRDLPRDEEELADIADAEGILEFLRGGLGPAVKWTIR